jgi:hypothetical protein
MRRARAMGVQNHAMPLSCSTGSSAPGSRRTISALRACVISKVWWSIRETQAAEAIAELTRCLSDFAYRARIGDRRPSAIELGGNDILGEPVIGTEGFDVDVTRFIADHQTTLAEAVAEIAEHRSVPPPTPGSPHSRRSDC